jgi:hypothetical protein
MFERHEMTEEEGRLQLGKDLCEGLIEKLETLREFLLRDGQRRSDPEDTRERGEVDDVARQAELHRPVGDLDTHLGAAQRASFRCDDLDTLEESSASNVADHGVLDLKVFETLSEDLTKTSSSLGQVVAHDNLEDLGRARRVVRSFNL